jgi:hypothetical protein
MKFKRNDTGSISEYDVGDRLTAYDTKVCLIAHTLLDYAIERAEHLSTITEMHPRSFISEREELYRLLTMIRDAGVEAIDEKID